MKKLNVAFLNTSLPGVTMYRFWHQMKYANKQGLANIQMQKYDMDELQSAAWENFLANKDWGNGIIAQIESMIAKKDIVVISKMIRKETWGLVSMLKQKYPQIKFVFDMDDYMFNVPTWNMASGSYSAGGEMFTLGREQIKLSDAMIVTTECLKTLYTSLCPNIFVFNNQIDFEFWKGLKPAKPHKKIRIGWAGANAHREDISLLTPAIDEIGKKYPHVEFYFWGPSTNFDEKLTSRANVVCDPEWVRMSKYPQTLASKGFDIGVAPVRDCYFNRAKSNVKYLEYSMLKVPVVASDIGEQFNETIEREKNGFLAKNPDEWIKYLSALIESANLRQEIGEAGYRNVDERYNAKKSAKSYVEILKAIKELPAKT